jgi:hypothetical protein
MKLKFKLFWVNWGNLLVLLPKNNHKTKIDRRTDGQKLASDWQMVGQDMKNASKVFYEQSQKS